jgi:hypothetical protein
MLQMMIKKFVLLFLVSFISIGANGGGFDFSSKDEFIMNFINKNILGSKVGYLNKNLEGNCRKESVDVIYPFSNHGFSYAYSCKVDMTRFLIGVNDKNPRGLINSLILVTNIKYFDDVNNKVTKKFGKCRYPRESESGFTCQYSIGVDRETKLGKIANVETDVKEKVVMFRLAVESGDGP